MVVEGLAYSELGGNDVPIPKVRCHSLISPYWTHSQCSMIKDDSTGRMWDVTQRCGQVRFGEMGSTQGFWIVDLSPKAQTASLFSFFTKTSETCGSRRTGHT